MKNAVRWIAGSIALAVVNPTPAYAEAVEGVFARERPVTDDVLSTARGGTALFATLSQGRVAMMADTNARGDFRFYGASAQYQMDIWWGTVGSELIAETVRANLPR